MISENYKIVPLMNAADVGGTPGTDCDSIDMSGYHKATFIFICATVNANLTFTPMSGISDGTKTNAVPSWIATGGAVLGTAVAGSTASCDVLSAWTASATTHAVTTCSNLMYVIEILGSSITEGDDWLTVSCFSNVAGNVFAVAILEPRYSENRSGTCLA